MRKEIFEESKALKEMLLTTKDIILLSSMWDACVVTINQLDAYFMMLGILNTIKRENLNEEAIYYITEWLKTTKKTGETNLKGLTNISNPVEPATEKHISKLKDFYNKLNVQIDLELEKLNTLKESLKIKK